MARKEVTGESRVISIMELPRLDLPQTDILPSPTIRKAIVGVKLASENRISNEDYDLND